MSAPVDSWRAAIADRYVLERELGAGGMASVFLAHDSRHNRKVAIKIMHPELAAIIGPDRFLKEIETTANLQHPHILPLFDSGRLDGTVFYVMPYVQGDSLRTRLTRETQLPVADAVRIAAEIASGLEYAHRHGVIHRDIKPDNVLFHDGRALLADFGIALARSPGTGGMRLTKSGVSLGTPQYMSPEQASGEHNVDPRTDIYALGVVLYEMLAGQPPFTGRTAQAIITQVMADEPRPLGLKRKSVPPHIDAAVARALEKLPADRWQTAAQFAEALTGGEGTGRLRSDGWRSVFASAGPWSITALLLGGLLWLGFRGERVTPPVAGPIRFNAELEPGVLPTFTPIVRLSADGRQLFVTAMVNRREEVLRRRFDQSRMDVIPGAGQGDLGTGNSRPFVSPDGRWIAYAKQGKLRKVPVEGGSAIDLAVSDWAGGSWGRNGKLVYGRSYNTGLWMVSEGGGDERMLTAPDTSKGELGHWWPQILPDGDHVIFTAYRTPIDQATIEVVSIRTGERKALFRGGVFGFYVPSGHLIYAAGEAIRAVPFDLKRLEVTGPALPVVDSVAMNYTDGAAAFDVSANGTLAYMPVSSYVTDDEMVLVDRQGHETRALPSKDRYDHPRFSPDGNHISADIRSANSAGDVWVFQIGRAGGTRVTAEGGRDFGAEWTPDGRELIYSSEHPTYDLYRRAADASRPAEPLVTGGYDRYTGAVSQDGKLLPFVFSQPNSGSELWIVPLQGQLAAKRYLANGFNLAHPSLSPNGRWMAYDSDESGRVEVFAQSFPDPNLKRWKISPTFGSEPMWTRGGRELIYRKGDSVMAVSLDLENGKIGQPVALFGGPYPDSPGWTRPRSYDVSRDGERFLMTRLPAERPRPQITVVLNWFDELRAKVPQ
ncbi:MAG TPA: protein kinase [Gemmatimonadales bacterium]|nr:protein kinase [Gemmatimonadales bacterium]